MWSRPVCEASHSSPAYPGVGSLAEPGKGSRAAEGYMSILGTRVIRTEDPRLLTAGGVYVDDLRTPELNGAAACSATSLNLLPPRRVRATVARSFEWNQDESFR